MGRAVERMLGRPIDDELLTALWLLLGPEVYVKLVDDAGWSRPAYEAFMAATMRRLATDE